MASVKYEYTCTITGDEYEYELYDTPYTVTLDSADWTFKGTFDIIYNNEKTVAKAPLERIYFFYYPAYSTQTPYPFEKDTIIFNNNLGRDISFYLMKQKNASMTDPEISIAEANYKPTITGNKSDASKSIVMYHNMTTNLANPSGDAGWNASMQTGMTLAETKYGDSLIVHEDKQLMYNVKVMIYEADAYKSSEKIMIKDAVSTMTGTFLNW